MKTNFTKWALLVLFLMAITLPKDLYGGVDVDEMKAKLPLMMGQSNIGRDYWFTIPPCYEEESHGADNFIKILIASPIKTKVTVEVPGKGFYKTLNTIPNGVIEFRLTPTQAQPILHAGNVNIPPPAQVYKGAGVHVFSDDPLVVYVVVRYRATSDGFLAIPTSSFGTAYINMVYKEPDITSGLMAPFTGITAAYDDTKIRFTMGGGDEGNDYVPLDGGRNLKTGETATENLNKGDVWLLSIGGHRQDLSGSRIEGNKPFSIVSGVHCANFPLRVYACDYTVEMELPIYTWGKQYYVVPMKGRTFNGIIRIYASEDNTKIYRDGQYLGTLKKGGGDEMGKAYHEMRLWDKFDDFGQPIPPKVATISADKPISVMYYNTGTSEDYDRVNTDPFMMIFSPIEQFQKEMYFASPNATSGTLPFSENYISIVFELHGEDIMPQDLQFATMSQSGAEPDWKPLSQVFSSGFEKFVIPYKGKYYGAAKLTLPSEGVYGIKSDSTKFASYSYGYGWYDSYGFPTAASLNDLTKPDTNAPVPTYVQECDGDVLKDMGTVMDMPDDDATRSNMADLYLIENVDNNYKFDWRSKTGEFIPGQQRTLSWWLTVVNKKKYAKAVIYFVDRAGNDTTITVEYNPPEYEVVSGNSFGLLSEKDAPVIMQDTIRNLSKSSPLYITSVKLQDGNQGFTIDSYLPAGWKPGTPIPALGEVIVNVKFDPKVAAALGLKPLYKDSLGVGYGDENLVECGFNYETEQNARLGSPVIWVEDYDFGKVNINDPNPKVKIITIKNEGDKDLGITGISKDLTVKEFTHDFKTKFPNVSITNPLLIKPGETQTFTVNFFPKAVGPFADKIVFTSNADQRDNVCEILGMGIDSKVSASGYEWGGELISRATFPAGPYPVDVSSTHKGLLISNLGTEGIAAKVVAVNVINETPANARNFFKVGNQNIVDYLNNSVRNRNIPAGGKIDEAVEYLPTEIGNHSIEIELVFDQSSGGEKLTISYKGTGLVPNLAVTDVTYGNMLIDDEANAQTGQYMTITNKQDEFGYPLTVSGINLTLASDVSKDITNFNGRTFRYDDAMMQTLMATPLAVGASVNIPVDFVARKVGSNSVTAEIVSNASTVDAGYDNSSTWIGNGEDLAISVSSPYTKLCRNESRTIPVTITNTGTDTVYIDNISLAQSDLNADGVDDLTIITPQTNLMVTPEEPLVVNVMFTPSDVIGRRFIGLVIETKYFKSQLTITNADKALEVEANSYSGKTTTNLSGASVNNSPSNVNYDKEFMVSIGDKFDYEIDYNALNGDVTGANVQSFEVKITYNKYFVQPEFANEPYKKIELIRSNMRIKTGTFAITDKAGGKVGEQEIGFTVESKDGSPILTTSGLLIRLPFLAVLPSDSQQFNPDDVIDGTGTSFGRFDMSHTLTAFGCYSHESDKIEVGIKEICSGNLRLLYIGDLTGQAPTVQPNPISGNGGTIEYSVPYDQPGEIAIYNTTMQKVAVVYNGELKQGRQSAEIPVSQLANGSYYFKITMGDKQEMGRLVIQK